VISANIASHHPTVEYMFASKPTNNQRLVVDCRITVAQSSISQRLADSWQSLANIANQ